MSDNPLDTLPVRRVLAKGVDLYSGRKMKRTIFLEDLMDMIERIKRLEHIKKYPCSTGIVFTEADEAELSRLKSVEITIPDNQVI